MPEIPPVAPNDLLESDEWGNPVARRTVQRYLDVANRDSLNPTPQQGDVAYLLDTNIVTFYTGATWSTLFVPLTGGTMSGPLLLPDGVVGTPALSFATDPDTGLFHTGTAMAFTFAAQTRMRLSGIGLEMFSVFGAEDGDRFLPSISFRADPDTGLSRFAADTLDFSTGGASRMRLANATFLWQSAIDNIRSAGVNAWPTTTGAANLNVQLSSDVGRFRISTSAKRFKRNIEPVTDLAEVPIPKPHMWQDIQSDSEEEPDDTQYVGFIADDWADLDERFAIRDADGELVNVHDRSIMAVMAAHIEKLETRIEALEAN